MYSDQKDDGEPRFIGRRRQLFLDDWLLEDLENIEREYEEPVKHPDNPVVKREHPWESLRCELYGSAVWDPEEKRIQLFYSTLSTLRPERDTKMGYAESRDGGKTWDKPKLDIFLWEGKKTNIVWPGRYQVHGPSVFRDPDDPDPARRYKMLTADYGGEDHPEAPLAVQKGRPGIDVAFSPDGINWTACPGNPVISDFKSDTGQSAFWDPESGRYIAYVRLRPKPRHVGRMESEDFENWTLPQRVYVPGPEDNERGWEYYSMSVTPYEGIYVGLVWIFPPETGKDPDSDTPATWPELVVSRDSYSWKRVCLGTPFLSVGPPGSFDRRMIRTASSFLVLDDRILLFYSGCPYAHISEAIRFDIGLATLRRDGFVALVDSHGGSANPSGNPYGMWGTVTTKPLLFDSGRLRINAKMVPPEVHRDSFIKAELLDDRGRPVGGYGLNSCNPFRGDSTDTCLSWNGRTTIPSGRGKGLRLRFVLKNAKLYSFWVD